MRTPKITKIVMNGILCSLFLNKNKITKDIIVIDKVIILKLANINWMFFNGFVSALEFAASKKACIF
jgi:hypothetical protein